MVKRLALIGVGKWGANFLRTIVASKQDELTFIVSSKSKQQIDEIAISHAQILPNIALLDEYAHDIDGAIVATPPDVRPEVVERLLNLGIPVLAEKPLSLDADASGKLVSLAKSLNVPLIEDFIHLYSWPYLKINQQLTDEWPKTIESKGGGQGPFRDYSALMDYAPHDLAMALQIFDIIPDEVHLELTEIKNKLAFTANIKLNFSERGHANISISNISSEKVRTFKLEQKNNCWIYDDNNPQKLTLNGVEQSSIFKNDSPLQIILDHFCERKLSYNGEKLLWLSQSVAKVLESLDVQYQTMIKNHLYSECLF